jgi:hypothetical protein
MAEVVERLDSVERRLTSVETGLSVALAPLARLDAFLPLVADEHEKRITDLERRSRIRE